MFDVDDLGGEEVFVARKDEHVVEKVVDVAQVSTAATTATITTKEITLAQALEALKTSKPKVKEIVFQEPGNSTTTTTISSKQSQDKGKGIMVEEPVKPRKKDQIRLDKEAALKLQAEFDKENMEVCKLKDLKLKEFYSIKEMFDRAFKKVNRFEDFRIEFVEGKKKRAGEELIQESTKKQMVKDDKETAELKQLMEIISDKEKVAIDAIPLDVKGDLEDLYKLVKAKFKSTRPVEDLDLLLSGDLKTMFEPYVDDEVWRKQQGYKVLKWKLYDSYGVYSLMMKSMQVYMLVEKTYPLTSPILLMMLEKMIQIDYQSEMAYQLLKLIKKQVKK
nr:hypothetical protein [Tanacetum cinerariifolium]